MDEEPLPPKFFDVSMSLASFEASMSLASFEESMSFDFGNLPSSDRDALIATSWTAIDIVPLTGKIIDNPITIEFESDTSVIGSTGCNRYGGSVELSDTTLSFGHRFQTTRRYCDGLMGQERKYLSFMSGSTFFYDIITADENGSDELVLYNSVFGSQGGEATRGEIVARFGDDQGVSA